VRSVEVLSTNVSKKEPRTKNFEPRTQNTEQRMSNNEQRPPEADKNDEQKI